MAEVYDTSGPSSSSSGFERERAVERQSTEEPSIATLLGGVVADAQELVRKEIDLAKQEVRTEIDKAKSTAISMGIGGAVAAIGGLLLVLMLVHLLSDVFGLSLWVSYLIVGAVFAIVGAILIQRGRSKASEINLVPQATVQEVKKDVEWIKQQTTSDET